MSMGFCKKSAAWVAYKYDGTMQRGEWPEKRIVVSYWVGGSSGGRACTGTKRTASLAGYFGCCAKSDLALLDVDLTVGGGGIIIPAGGSRK